MANSSSFLAHLTSLSRDKGLRPVETAYVAMILYLVFLFINFAEFQGIVTVRPE